MHDRRFELRTRHEEAVDLCWENHLGQTQHATAQLVDISPSGASVDAQRPVRAGAMLSLSYHNQKLIGKVMHCALQGSGYRLGVELQAGYRWSPRQQ